MSTLLARKGTSATGISRTDTGCCGAVLAKAHAQAGGATRLSCAQGCSRGSSRSSSRSSPSAAGRPALAPFPAALTSPHQSSSVLCASGKTLFSAGNKRIVVNSSLYTCREEQGAGLPIYLFSCIQSAERHCVALLPSCARFSY